MNHLLKILFKHQTDNTDERPSLAIAPCLRELASYLKAQGVHVEIQGYEVVSRGGGKVKHANLLAYNRRSRGSFILFQGHVDTVPSTGPHTVTINKKIIRGRGAVDMKGSLAGMITAFVKLQGITGLKYPPALLITGDEEANGFAGIRHFLKNNPLSILFAINGEPNDLTLSTKLRGVLMYTIERTGELGHSASVRNDRLIEKTIPLLAAIKKFLDRAREISDPRYGKTIAALTVFNSGVKANQLPGSLKINFNLRTVSNVERYESLFRKIIGPCISNDVRVKKKLFNPIEVSLDHHIFTGCRRAFRQVKLRFETTTVAGFTEASLMNLKGIPTIVCGPGDVSLAHVKPELEQIKIRDIKNYTSLLVAILESF